LPNSKEIDEFLGKLKDPDYGKPVVIARDAPVSVFFTITVDKTGEMVNFINHTNFKEGEWYVYGNERKPRVMTRKQVESLVLDYIIVAQRQKSQIKLVDPCICVDIRADADITKYV
jgi:hypothetical protein